MNHLNLEEFERKIAYTFSDKNLLILALTHSSYANETKKGSHENNERLEFLGDAVLDMVVSEYMYRHFPKMPEGELTKLRAAVVCEGSLAELSRKLGVGRCLLLGKGEESTGGRSRDSILADAFEAIIGAICMDGGMEAVTKYIMGFMEERIESTKSMAEGSLQLLYNTLHVQPDGTPAALLLTEECTRATVAVQLLPPFVWEDPLPPLPDTPAALTLQLTMQDVMQADTDPEALGRKLAGTAANKRWLHHPKAETFLAERVALLQRVYKR